MSSISDNSLEAKIERKKEKIDLTLDRWENIPPERKPYFRLGRQARSIGIYTTLLGESEDAVEWFEKASDRFQQAWKKVRGDVNEPQMAMWTLLTAILSTSDDYMTETAEEIVEVDIANPEPEYYTRFVLCLASLVLGDDETAITNADTLTALESEALENTQYYPSLGEACNAIVDENTDALNTALTRVLERHEERIPRLGETSDDALVCIPATVLLLLAHKRGLTIKNTDVFQSKYVPSVLFK